MALTEIFQSLGEERFRQLTKSISISRLKTYQLYDSIKTRAHLPKLNTQGLKKATPKFWERLQSGDEDLASDLAQAVLVSNFEMIIEVLDFLGVPHSDGFFDKDFDASEALGEGWQQKAFDNFKDKFAEAVLLFYLNHLSWEVTDEKTMFQPAGAE
jgi:hypothetical protein